MVVSFDKHNEREQLSPVPRSVLLNEAAARRAAPVRGRSVARRLYSGPMLINAYISESTLTATPAAVAPVPLPLPVPLPAPAVTVATSAPLASPTFGTGAYFSEETAHSLEKRHPPSARSALQN